MGDYKFIVVPSDEFTNEAIISQLNEVCAGTGSEITFHFENREMRGYMVEHFFVVRLRKVNDARFKFQLFEQEGEGRIRKYGIPSGKKSKKVREVEKQLKDIERRKG